MIYIKKFNEELDSETYLRASRKLKKIGQIERSEKLKEYGIKIMDDENITKWKKNIIKYSKFGSFNIKIKNNKTGKELIDSQVKFSNIKLSEMDDCISLSDRPSVGRFKNLIKNIFMNPNFDYPSGYNSYHSMYDLLECKILAECGYSSDYGLELKDIGNYIKSFNANKLLHHD